MDPRRVPDVEDGLPVEALIAPVAVSAVDRRPPRLDERACLRHGGGRCHNSDGTPLAVYLIRWVSLEEEVNMQAFTETRGPQLMRVREVAQVLGQCPETIYRKVQAGELRAVRLGGGRAALRIPRDELERFLTAGRERV